MQQIEIKKFKDVSDSVMEKIIDIHYNHWVKFNSNMDKQTTTNKFMNIYRLDTLPFGIAMFENNNLIGFCVFKIENLKKYPHIYPWLSDVMILNEYRHKGYGKKLIEYGEAILKEYGYSTIYVWTDQAPDFYKKLGFYYVMQVEKNEGGFGQLFCKNI